MSRLTEDEENIAWHDIICICWFEEAHNSISTEFSRQLLNTEDNARALNHYPDKMDQKENRKKIKGDMVV